jgi:hypothetical protein
VITRITPSAASGDIDFTTEQKRTCMVRIFRVLALGGNSDYGRAQA